MPKVDYTQSKYPISDKTICRSIVGVLASSINRATRAVTYNQPLFPQRGMP